VPCAQEVHTQEEEKLAKLCLQKKRGKKKEGKDRKREQSVRHGLASWEAREEDAREHLNKGKPEKKTFAPRGGREEK